jgi:hypothetical protein
MRVMMLFAEEDGGVPEHVRVSLGTATAAASR